MKKHAHTLSEVLIALGIVGILGAVVAPMASKFKPDINKVKFLKNYDAIVQANNDMIYQDTLFPEKDTNYEYPTDPLYNTNSGFVGKNAGQEVFEAGTNKYCRVLGYYLIGNQNEANCSEDYFDSINGNPSFTSINGTDYWVYTNKGDPAANNQVFYRTNIFMDIDGDGEGKNCLYNPQNCPMPDRFRITVKANGDTLPADPKGRQYLRTRTNYRLDKNENPTVNDSTDESQEKFNFFVETIQQN